MNQLPTNLSEDFYLRFVEEEDCDDIFEWRNDPTTVKYSLTNEVEYDTHLKWFKKIIKDPYTRLFILFDKSLNKIGMVRFDEIDKETSEVSINLNPSFRGSGHGAIGLTKAIDMFFKNFHVKTIKAKIKKENTPSKTIFEKIGFEKKQEEEKICLYSLNRSNFGRKNGTRY